MFAYYLFPNLSIQGEIFNLNFFTIIVVKFNSGVNTVPYNVIFNLA